MAINPKSPEWLAVEAWAKPRLESAQRELEAVGLPAGATEMLRGRILELKALLKLPNPSRIPPQMPQDGP